MHSLAKFVLHLTISTRMHINEVAFAIIQNQQHSTPFQILGSRPDITVKDLCMEHCRSDIETSRSFLSHWPFEACLWRHLYMAIQPLIIMLNSSEDRQLFHHCHLCRILVTAHFSRRTSKNPIQAGVRIQCGRYFVHPLLSEYRNGDWYPPDHRDPFALF